MPQVYDQGQIQARPYRWPHDCSLSPQTTALVVIDMQRDCGYLEAQGYDIAPVRAIIPQIQRLMQTFRNANYPIYHTREGHRPDLSTLSSRERFRSYNNTAQLGIGSQGPLGRLLVRGEPGHDIIPELYPRDNEPVIDKPGRGAFAHTEFELMLRIKGVKNLVICGVTTDVCVSSTMREANDRAFDCILIENCTATGDKALCDATIESIETEGGIFGAVGTADDMIAYIQQTQS